MDGVMPRHWMGNELCYCMVRRVLALVAAGACVIIENPLWSYLWMLNDMAGLIGMPAFHLV